MWKQKASKPESQLRRSLFFSGMGAVLYAAYPRLAVAERTLAPRALREMQIHKLPELGLEIWVENQPPWETELRRSGTRPSFIAQSPEGYHPPTVMSYSSWPKERVKEDMLETMAVTAIRRASQNFGLSMAQSRALLHTHARYGGLQGYETNFNGKSEGMEIDVRIFVGQALDKFPVAMSIYTLSGKMGHLSEQLRRAWGNLAYLPREG